LKKERHECCLFFIFSLQKNTTTNIAEVFILFEGIVTIRFGKRLAMTTSQQA